MGDNLTEVAEKSTSKIDASKILITTFGGWGRHNTSHSETYRFSKEEVGFNTTLRTHASNWKKLAENLPGGREGVCDLIKDLIKKNQETGDWGDFHGNEFIRSKIPIYHLGDEKGEPFMFVRIEYTLIDKVVEIILD